MTVLRPRSRSISVRLSQEEFDALQRLCASTGARSVSDLARRAMQEVLERTQSRAVPERGGYGDQIGQLEQRVAELASELALFKAQQHPRPAES